MYLITLLTIIINIIALSVLIIGIFYKFEQPKLKAEFGYIIVGSMFIYFILLSFIALYGLFTNKNLYSLFLMLCVISPFIIGKLVKYKTVKKYTVVQIACFIFGLVILLLKF